MLGTIEDREHHVLGILKDVRITGGSQAKI